MFAKNKKNTDKNWSNR